MCCPLIFTCYSQVRSLRVILHLIEMTRYTHENNASKFSKREPHHKHKQKPQDIAQHKPYLKVL